MFSREKERYCNPEIWGGIECTISRINDDYSDQLLSTGHYSRPSDIDRLADLGIKALRYPILWERHQPDRETPIDWSWAAGQLAHILRREMTPIAGLLHHGSGPSFTDLSCPHFAEYFADYAGQVAARFPWLELYTPINEPLTTARFSGLYGIWYPHRKDALEFVNMLLNQVKGVVLAMKAIRSVNPAAKLIQTEDLAKIHSHSELSYQVDFENHRRWLTFDLLGGRVDKNHPLWNYLLFLGVKEQQLAFFSENPCLPDIMGLNYYITSERFLDGDIEKYPADRHGGNGRHRYVDTEAVRVIEPSGLSTLLKEAWERYQLPIAITEAHLDCTREEQMRWIKHIWDSSCKAKRQGIDIRAVTAWALLGASDWDSLLSQSDGHYESGAYDIRSNEPRLTAVGHFISAIASGKEHQHSLVETEGWWGRHRRREMKGLQQLLLVGAKGEKGLNLLKICQTRGIACKFLLHTANADLCRFIEQSAELYRPWGIILQSEVSVEEVSLVAACRQKGISLICLSADKEYSTEEMNNMLDIFIDQAILTYFTYARKQVHVCDRDREQLSCYSITGRPDEESG